MKVEGEGEQPRICIVGAGTRFLSGISVYTYRLAGALAVTNRVSAILMRQLLPTRFYPGRQRVGRDLSRLQMEPSVRMVDGVDWYWIPSMLPALVLLVRERPQIVVFQWWTGTVLHTYLALALIARLLGARVIVEFHEILDTGELRLRPAASYVQHVAPWLMQLAHGFTVHAEADCQVVEQHYALHGRPLAVLPVGPFDHYREARQTQRREAPDSTCNLLFFGVIRPYKGLEDLIEVFDTIPQDRIGEYWLTVAGETWEGWTAPTTLIEQSRYRDRITLVNRYVPDDEVDALFSGADAVVLPYRRSHLSGPLHIAMAYGLPVIVTDVGGLAESVEGYEGALLIPAHDRAALVAAIDRVRGLRGRRFDRPHSWEHTAAHYEAIFRTLLDESPVAQRIGA